MGWRRTRREEKTTTKMMRGDRRTRVGRFVVRGRRRGGRYDGCGGRGAPRTTAPKLSASADNGSSARRDRGGKPPSSSSSGAKRTAKGRRRRRKKLHGDVMTTFDKVARRPRGDGYSAEGSAAAAVAAAADQPVTMPVDAAAGGGGRRMRQERRRRRRVGEQRGSGNGVLCPLTYFVRRC